MKTYEKILIILGGVLFMLLPVLLAAYFIYDEACNFIRKFNIQITKHNEKDPST